MRVAQVRRLQGSKHGADRYMEMLHPSLEQALSVLPPTCRVPLALALPPHRPGRPEHLAQQLLDRIETHYGGRLHPAVCFESGHAAALQALATACNSLGNGSIPLCLVAGVDSYLAPQTLEWLEDSEQLHGGGAQNNAWGFVPGEAAAAMLIVTAHVRAHCPAPVQAEVMGVGTGHESMRIKTDTVCVGAGLTQAFRQALQALPPGSRVDNVFCDMNGEAYRADEYGFTALRTREHFRDPTDFVAPADCWGDVGAAGAVLHVAMAAACCARGYGRGPLSLVWGSSESGERGAALIQASFVHRE